LLEVGRRALIALAGLLGLLGLAAGCATANPPDGGGKAAAPANLARPKSTFVQVAVIDGDLRSRVHGALVRIGRSSGRTDRTGWVRLHTHRRGAFRVTVTKPGYGTSTGRVAFRQRAGAAVPIYQTALQWRMFGATPARTQAQTHIRLRPPFRIVWGKPTGGLIEFPAVVDQGVAYFGNFDGTIQALSMSNGARIWRHYTTNGKMAASPAVVGESVVVHGMDGYVRVLNRRNGHLLWRFAAGSPIESSPVVRDGVDYFGTWSGNVYALDLRRHRLRWVFHSGYKITSSVSFGGGKLYIGDYGGRVLALSPVTGRPRWIGRVNGRIYGTPAFAGGRVFVPSSTGNSLTAFSGRGRRLWSVNTGSYVYSSPAVWAGRVFFGSYNGVLYAVSARSGAVLWRFATGGAISAAPVVVDGVVYCGNFQHRIYGLDAHSGRQLLRFPHGEYVPVSGNGGRLLLHGTSHLYAVEPRR
jgi:outer membrane protein assembly factor BamB